MLLKGDSDCCCCCAQGKHFGPEGRTESKICVSPSQNVPSKISYKKLAIRFTFLEAGCWVAASCCNAAAALTAAASA